MSTPRLILWRDQDRSYLGLLLALAITFALVIAVFFVIFESARVDGESMLPTLLPEDRVLITRGYDTPRVGDVVSATILTDTGPDSVIKRVIALPGDTVVISGDVAYVNGAASTAAPSLIVAASEPASTPVVVPAGRVYLLGDNRPVSYDSRFTGPVPLADVSGRVVAVFSPITRWRIVD
jgi:signal peptidase I